MTDDEIVEAMREAFCKADESGGESIWWKAALAVARQAIRDQALDKAAGDVVAERERQISGEGWTPEHDDAHKDGTLALAACCYAMPKAECQSAHASGVSIWRVLWPWDLEWWKPKDRRRNLVRAGALILAEIERLDRAALKGSPHARD